jgi:YD repeat-containing protein
VSCASSEGWGTPFNNYVKDGQSLSRFQYEYDAVGRRTALTDSYGRHEFAYDEAGQLIAARWQQMGKERFGYDAAGNMLFNREYDFTYGTGNRLLSCKRQTNPSGEA